MASSRVAPSPPARNARRERHLVVVVALPGVVAFELGLPHRFFCPSTPSLPYEVATVTLDDGPVLTSAGYRVLPSHPGSLLTQADTVVVPGVTDPTVAANGTLSPELLALLDTVPPDARWVSICTGAFVLAALGLLDGLEVTTHWRYADHFAEVFPRVHVNPDVLYVDNGRVLTSAGNAAGIDLLLHVLRRDQGTEVANAVARGAVVAPWRAGGQAQFIERPVPQPGDAGTGPARAWVLDHLQEPVTLSGLSHRAGMSVRTFTRRFREETGETAGAWLSRVRVERARHLLETTDLPVDRVAELSGFGTAASLRLHLSADVGLSPLAYRRTYRQATA